jgi:hypothetical protein
MDTKNPDAGDENAKARVAHDASELKDTLKQFGGSRSEDWNRNLVAQTLGTLSFKHSDKEASDGQDVAALAGLSFGIGPKDELEGMIGAQLLAAHNAAMECYRRSTVGGQTFEGRGENLNQANKLSRTYVMLLDALDRHRGKRQQKLAVEHLHLHVGAQAVVGAVDPNQAVSQRKLEGQHDAKQIVHAPQQAVWSSDTERQPVPVAGDAERPMSTARREIDGSTEGEQERA